MAARILVVEDDFINQKVAQQLLRKAGFTVDSVWDGEDAVQACSRHDYDVVLMDWRLPVVDGLEAARQIRKLARHQPVIIAVTAHALPGDRETCLASGMDHYLAKPYNLNQLLQIVRESLFS